MEDAFEELTTEPPVCVHHWILEAPVGSTTAGRCRVCGELRDFVDASRTGGYVSRHRRKA